MSQAQILSDIQLHYLTCEILTSGIVTTGRGVIVVAGPPIAGKTSLRLRISQIITSIIPSSSLVVDIGPSIGFGLSTGEAIRLACKMGAAAITVGEELDTSEINMLFAAALRRLVVVEVNAPDVGATLESLRSDYGLADGVIAESLQLLVVQRLVRLLCAACKAIDMDHFRDFNDRGDIRPARFRPVGCPACGDTGYRGSAVVVQTCKVTNEMRKLLRHGADSGQVLAVGRSEGGLEELGDIAERLLGPGVLSNEERSRLMGYRAAAAAY